MKNDIKYILIITFVIAEILSMIFNNTFTQITLGTKYFTFNFSVIFFCFGFFIIDIINDFFSPAEAEKFFYYKLYVLILFVSLTKISLIINKLDDSWLSNTLNESPKMIIDGLIASFFGYKIMNYLMAKMNLIYKGRSVFIRYILSTVPGEIAFSFIFTFLNFSLNRNFTEIMHIFTISAITKIMLSIIFSFIVACALKIKFYHTSFLHKNTQPI